MANPSRKGFGLLARLRLRFRRKVPTAAMLRQPAAPSVVLACTRCGFDYTVTRFAVDGKTGLIWTCECGSELIPPGGPESFNLVRP